MGRFTYRIRVAKGLYYTGSFKPPQGGNGDYGGIGCGSMLLIMAAIGGLLSALQSYPAETGGFLAFAGAASLVVWFFHKKEKARDEALAMARDQQRVEDELREEARRAQERAAEEDRAREVAMRRVLEAKVNGLFAITQAAQEADFVGRRAAARNAYAKAMLYMHREGLTDEFLSLAKVTIGDEQVTMAFIERKARALGWVPPEERDQSSGERERRRHRASADDEDDAIVVEARLLGPSESE